MFEKKARFSIRMRRYCVRARAAMWGSPGNSPGPMYINNYVCMHKHATSIPTTWLLILIMNYYELDIQITSGAHNNDSHVE